MYFGKRLRNIWFAFYGDTKTISDVKYFLNNAMARVIFMCLGGLDAYYAHSEIYRCVIFAPASRRFEL
jgi:hypothetical protein